MYPQTCSTVSVFSRCARRIAARPPRPIAAGLVCRCYSSSSSASPPPSSDASAFKSKSLRHARSVLVLRDSETRRPKRADAAQHARPEKNQVLRARTVKPQDIPRILEDMQKQSEVAGQVEINEAIEQQRPAFSRNLALTIDDDRCVVSAKTFKDHTESLTEQFTRSQLLRYVAIMEAKRLEAMAKESAEPAKPPPLIVQGPWHALARGNPVSASAKSNRITAKNAVAVALLRSVWKLDIREEVEVDGEQLLRATQKHLRVLALQHRHTPNAPLTAYSLPAISQKHGTRIAMHLSDIKIYGSKNACKMTATAIEEAARQVYKVPLDSFPDRFFSKSARSSWSEFANEHGCIFQGDRRRVFVGPTKEDALACFRAFVTRLLADHQPPTAVFTDPSQASQTSPTPPSPEAIALSTTRSDLQTRLHELDTSLSQGTIDQIVASLETQRPVRQPAERPGKAGPPVSEHTESDQHAPAESTENLAWTPTPTTTCAVTIGDGQNEQATGTLGLSQILAHTPSFATTKTILTDQINVDLVPLPGPELEVERASALPTLRLTFKLDEKSQRLWLQSADIAEKATAHVQIPRLAVALDVSRETKRSLESGLSSNAALVRFTKELEASVSGLGRIQLPEAIELELPPGYQDPSLPSHITFVPVKLEIAQELDLDFEPGVRLVVRSVMAGKNNPSQETVSLVTSAGAERDAPDSAKTVLEASGRLLQQLHGGLHRPKLAQPAELLDLGRAYDDASDEHVSVDETWDEQTDVDEAQNDNFSTGEAWDEDARVDKAWNDDVHADEARDENVRIEEALYGNVRVDEAREDAGVDDADLSKPSTDTPDTRPDETQEWLNRFLQARPQATKDDALSTDQAPTDPEHEAKQ